MVFCTEGGTLCWLQNFAVEREFGGCVSVIWLWAMQEVCGGWAWGNLVMEGGAVGLVWQKRGDWSLLHFTSR